MKIKIINTGDLRQAIINSGIIEWIEKNIELEDFGAGIEVGSVYVVTHSTAQAICDDSEFEGSTYKKLEE